MSSRSTTRLELLDGVKTALQTRFNASTGTVRKLFRDLYRGPVRPIVTGRPVCGVADGGQRRGEDGDRTGASNGRVVTVLVTCHIDADWEKVNPARDWTQYVEEIIEALDGNLTVGAGLIELNYVSDDPVEIVFAAGESEAAWVLTFEAVRFVDY
jgi:hypothetical protein